MLVQTYARGYFLIGQHGPLDAEHINTVLGTYEIAPLGPDQFHSGLPVLYVGVSQHLFGQYEGKSPIEELIHLLEDADDNVSAVVYADMTSLNGEIEFRQSGEWPTDAYALRDRFTLHLLQNVIDSSKKPSVVIKAIDDV